MNLELPDVPDLGELETRFRRAFSGGDGAELDIIGYGEISSVVRWEGTSGPVAAKRLPNYASRDVRDAHHQLMVEYIDELQVRGVDVVPTAFHQLDADDGTLVLYTVQPLISPERLAVDVLRGASQVDGRTLLERIVDHTVAVAGDPVLGLDVQLSNWVLFDDGLGYLDISTPFMRDLVTGLSRLDTSIFVASLPWALRWPVQRFLAEDIVAEYFDARTTLLNAIANLHKERLTEWIPVAVEAANARLDHSIERADVDRYYAKDQRLWAVLQWLRRVDRRWQLSVRRRPYPVLLPGRIER